jgi:MGT family glycosyltransferase
MARFLAMTFPLAGHVVPLVPILRQLIDFGHEVVWIAGRSFQAQVEKTGATFRALPMKIDPGEMDIYDLYPELRHSKGLAQAVCYLKTVFLAPSISQIESIDEVLADFPADVLVGDVASVGPFLKAELAGFPSAMISVCPLCCVSRDTAPSPLGLLPGTSAIAKVRNRILNFLVHGVLLRDVTIYANNLRENLGLKRLRGPAMKCGDNGVPSVLIQTSTHGFEYPRSDLPEHTYFIGPILSEPDPSFQTPHWWADLQSSKPVVLVTQGTLAKDPTDLIVPTLDGLKRQNVLVVAVSVRREQLADCPENARVEPFIPFGNLLPYVDVMVTNGGYGGTQMALAQGIPVVVAGATEDKMEVGARVQWSRTGINLRTKRPSPQRLREAVNEVLSNGVYRENARRIQADFSRHNAPREAAEILVALSKGEIGGQHSRTSRRT